MSLTSVPDAFATLEEANDYLRKLHRDLEQVTRQFPINKSPFALGTFSDRRDASTVLSTAQLQELVQTLINDLKRNGTLNATRD